MPHRRALKKGDSIYISNDQYIIERLISRGGTALIYEAYRPYCNNNLQEELEGCNIKKVIIKELAPYDIPFTRTEKGMVFKSQKILSLEQIFRNEVKNISTIQQQNSTFNRIPDMDAFGKYGGTIYIAMDYIKGTLLSKYIQQQNLNDSVVITLFKSMLKIVQALHNMDQPYLHLDLKPSNFIVSGFGTLYLFDFGSALLTNGKWIKNYTESYSAPEVIFNQMSKINKTADIYSLGAILYEMITKKVPIFERLLLMEGKYYKVKQNNIDFNPILAKLLHPDETKRFQSIEEVLADLQEK